jgi:hypothetical protein
MTTVITFFYFTEGCRLLNKYLHSPPPPPRLVCDVLPHQVYFMTYRTHTRYHLPVDIEQG